MRRAVILLVAALTLAGLQPARAEGPSAAEFVPPFERLDWALGSSMVRRADCTPKPVRPAPQRFNGLANQKRGPDASQGLWRLMWSASDDGCVGAGGFRTEKWRIGDPGPLLAGLPAIVTAEIKIEQAETFHSGTGKRRAEVWLSWHSYEEPRHTVVSVSCARRCGTVTPAGVLEIKERFDVLPARLELRAYVSASVESGTGAVGVLLVARLVRVRVEPTLPELPG